MNTVPLDMLLFTPVSLHFPPPWAGHIPFAAYLAKRFRPKCFVELGTDYGNSYFAFCQALKEERVPVTAYAVDTWQGDEQARFYQEDVFEYVSRHNEELYAGFSSLLRMTFDQALGSFADGGIDLLHIDGLHSYEAVSHDFAAWLPKLAPGAVVLFHDMNERGEGFGVWKLWEELRAEYKNTFSFPHSHGLGVLQLEGGDPARQLEIFSFTPEEEREFQAAFAAMGERHQYRYSRDELQKEANDLRRMLAEKNALLADKDALLADKDALLAHKDTLLAGETAEKDAVRRMLQEILASRSWRVTQPLRMAMSCLRKARNAPS